jgi:hypothetical protein
MDFQQDGLRRPVDGDVDTQRNGTAVGAGDLVDSRRFRRGGDVEMRAHGAQLLPAARTTTRHAMRVEGTRAFDERQQAGVDQLGQP